MDNEQQQVDDQQVTNERETIFHTDLQSLKIEHID